MRKIYTYLSLLILLLAASCQQEDLATTPALQPGEYRFSVAIPEPIVASRALGDQPQDVANMPMHVLVFDENGFYIATQKATVESFNGTEGTYTVNLPKNDGRTILHFVLGDVAYGMYAPTETEVSIFSTLTVSDGQDAYWARTEIEGGINESTQLPYVTLVRNFAKITVTAAGQNVPAAFQLVGFAIVNETTGGTVAPYTGSGFATFELPGTDDAYTEFRTLNPGFGGNSVGSLDDTTPQDADFTTDAKYVYERNQDEAANPAYILVKATFDGKPCYYKLDIVRQDEDTWLTSYLNLYRNFAYHVTINSVAGAGYDTPGQAMNAVASNNISASVEVSQVNSIQDGQGNVLTVDDLDIMITTPGAHTLGYEYREGAVNGSDGTVCNDEEYVRVIPVSDESEDGINHRAVQSVECKYNGTITITPVSPLPDNMETQEFVVTTRSGLSRRVTVNVRKPFNFDAVDCDDQVELAIGSELTVVVRLPANMPTSVFPLTLDIEPDKKSIYPDVAKNRIPVEAEGNYTFQYKATVTYNEYRRNPVMFFHFKTNMRESATTITVSNPHFEATPEHPNTCSFVNMGEGETRTDFGNVTLNGERDIYHFKTYYTQGQTLTLAFDLPCESSTHTDGSNPVEIFADYLDLENAQTTTGKFTLRSDGEGILYVPNNATERQEITFTVTQDYASETIQLSAMDHKTATIDYSTPSLTLTVNYRIWGSSEVVPNGTEVSIYKDANYSEFVESKTVNGGQISMDTFVGFTGTDNIYFSCEVRSGRNTYTCRGHATVEELIEEGSITLSRL
ncbi:hypothetical protein H6B14_09395 [Phocaeicola coprophilus]|nr:hypothetical protein [Phocaeicola coprophilus]